MIEREHAIIRDLRARHKMLEHQVKHAEARVAAAAKANAKLKRDIDYLRRRLTRVQGERDKAVDKARFLHGQLLLQQDPGGNLRVAPTVDVPLEQPNVHASAR